tara:strand:- start:5461 stop:6615 length:1155 start_codon:yes stop_codon:yes gene_type:complete
MSIDDEWSSFILNQDTNYEFTSLVSNKNNNDNDNINEVENNNLNDVIPECEDLYISTTTKVLFLNQSIPFQEIFWKIPIIEYWKPESGVLKKQMKVVSTTEDELIKYQDKLKNLKYYSELIIKQINNPDARRIKFKDERKITIGLSKRDIMTCRGKVKNAFYNCFALVMRFKYENTYREIHVKIFNTGKLEIPGVLNEEILNTVKNMILNIIQPYLNKPLSFLENNTENNVLINSNFNCGYYINRDKLYSILRNKYGIETSYDPCSYPGVKCKYYFNNEKGFDVNDQTGQVISIDRNMKMDELGENIKYTEISFMIFRTGSCLIVGNCSEKILRFVYNFIKQLFHDQYYNICVTNTNTEIKVKKEKIRKKTLNITLEYYNHLYS